MVSPINSVYLSGWEYNRLLQDDPLEPRNSALPAEVLWDGSAMLWLFEKVYCTREALECERYASETLGWTTGAIFDELAQPRNGILHSVDWRKDLTVETAKRVREQHAKMRAKLSAGGVDVRQAIMQNNEFYLDQWKQELLDPILNQFKCLPRLSPSSLRTWTDPSATLEGNGILVRHALDQIAAPVDKGVVVTRPPGTGVRGDLVDAQKKFVHEVEKPLIPDLVAGTGSFAGARGYVPHVDALTRHKDVFGPIDDQIRSDWLRNKYQLFALRDAAEKNLWPQLHREWLPRLLKEQGLFYDQFCDLVAGALRGSRFATLLNMDSKSAKMIGFVTGPLVLALAAAAMGVPIEWAAGTSAIVAPIGGALAREFHASQNEKYGKVALFYRNARQIGKKARKLTR
jgi:hypothetical protein